MGLSRIVSEIFNVEKYRDLEILVKGQSRSLKLVPFDRLGMVSYYRFIVALSLRRTIFSDIRLVSRDLSRPSRGVITPQFSCDTPNHLKFKGGYQEVFTGGVYVIVMEWVINVVKY